MESIDTVDISPDLELDDSLIDVATKRFSGALKELHTVACQNLITSTRECIARQLSNYCEDRILKEKQGNDDTCENDDAEEYSDSLSVGSDTKKRCQSLVCKHEGCGRKFTWPAHYKYHQLTHTDERPYKCIVDGCNRDFFTAQRLAVHMRIHTGERPFVCREEGCGKSFTTAGNLRNHNRIHSGEKPFVCLEIGCNKKFAEASSLKKHKFVHSGKKPFICDICGKTFSQSGSRNVHRRRHQNSLAPVDGIDEHSKCNNEIEFADATLSQNLFELNEHDKIVTNHIFNTEDASSNNMLGPAEEILLFSGNREIVTITNCHQSREDDFVQSSEM
ncbi:zinc finger protein 410-like [Centruroides sculpturatus]|uniref:zinc finger protein 410-like n=1 Tax=Centruroides sculpturatus TaxID=218467 RepID=UPI000C6CC79D|nr:zinc finger protein 410-like [Centruroides sculpturatus]XP_023243734.1 zinc finger protein 410-like [Centruroides sculpturatus]